RHGQRDEGHGGEIHRARRRRLCLEADRLPGTARGDRQGRRQHEGAEGGVRHPMSTVSLTRAQEQRLKQALLGDEKLGVTELRVINTDVYRQRLGSEWFKYKNIINAYATQAIKANMSAEDIFVPTKHGYAVFFFAAAEEKVKAASEMMAQELSRLLATENVFQDPPVSCSARPMTRSELVSEIDLDLG